MTCDVTYDVLGNERHKAVCELRKLPDGYPSYSAFPFAKWYKDLSLALGIGDDEVSCAKVRDTLIHLLGGDQVPVTLGDPYGIWKGDGGVDAGGRVETGGGRSDAAADGHMADCAGNLPAEGVAPITDELRKYVQSWRETPNLMDDLDAGDIDGLLGDFIAIADRIDAAHQKAEDEWKAKDGQTWLKGYSEWWLKGYSECHAELLEGNETLVSDLEGCGWVRLPLGADNVPIRAGDVLDGYGKTIEVVELRHGRSGWVLISRDGNGYADTLAFTHHAPTVEDVLTEFVERWHEAKRGERTFDYNALVAEYAKRLTMAGDGE